MKKRELLIQADNALKKKGMIYIFKGELTMMEA